jgi:hypothetical protein
LKNSRTGAALRKRVALPDVIDGHPSERVWEILQSRFATSTQSNYGEIKLMGQAGL